MLPRSLPGFVAFGSVVTLAAALSGCPADETVDAVVSPCSAAGIEGCIQNQQACERTGSEETCVVCEAGRYAAPSGSCDPIVGEATRHEFDEFSVKGGEEVSGLCQSWTLGNETELWINAVELEQDEASHHSNWTFVPDTKYEGPDGVWPCDERGYDQLGAAVAGGVLYAQSTQAAREVQKFPDGAAVRVPPHARIIGDVHLLNTGTETVTGKVAMTLYAIPAAEVTAKLAPFHMTYEGLAIPPLASSRFHGSCKLDEQFETQVGAPLSMRLFYALPHTHALGRRFFLEAVGGPRDGERLFDVTGYNGEPRGRLYPEPIDLTGITGLAFGCEFENPRDETIHYGIGDQEMCEMLGFIESSVAFESRIDVAEPDGKDGDMQVFTGPCSTLMIPWDSKQ